jgi:CRISPR-associated protein Csd1
VRAEHFDDSRQKKYDAEGRIRAAILKACLNRKMRVSNPNSEKEMTVALDPSNMNVGYRLGRLFAVLEKIQEDANPGINATIRDRFYGAASSCPITVFPQIMNKLTPHHLSKLKNEKPGLFVIDEKWLLEIISGLPGEMKAHLVMEDQARFAIGYYHQRQALFTSNKENTKGE